MRLLLVAGYLLVGGVTCGIIAFAAHQSALREYPESTPDHVELMDYMVGVVPGCAWPLALPVCLLYLVARRTVRALEHAHDSRVDA